MADLRVGSLVTWRDRALGYIGHVISVYDGPPSDDPMARVHWITKPGANVFAKGQVRQWVYCDTLMTIDDPIEAIALLEKFNAP